MYLAFATLLFPAQLCDLRGCLHRLCHQLRFVEIGVRHHTHLRQNLFGNLPKHRRSYVAAVIGAPWLINNHNDYHRRIVDGSESDKGRHKLRRRVSSRPGVNFLGRAGFACGCIPVQLRLLSGTIQGDALQHSSQGGGSLLLYDAVLFGIWTVGCNAISISNLANKVRSYTHTIICQRTESRHHLQRCNTDLLANSYGTN